MEMFSRNCWKICSFIISYNFWSNRIENDNNFINFNTLKEQVHSGHVAAYKIVLDRNYRQFFLQHSRVRDLIVLILPFRRSYKVNISRCITAIVARLVTCFYTILILKYSIKKSCTSMPSTYISTKERISQSEPLSRASTRDRCNIKNSNKKRHFTANYVYPRYTTGYREVFSEKFKLPGNRNTCWTDHREVNFTFCEILTRMPGRKHNLLTRKVRCQNSNLFVLSHQKKKYYCL